MLVVSATLLGVCANAPPSIRLATTTSVDNSGLLEVLLPAFTKQTGIRVDAVAVGSGKALQLARRGDADMTLTHDPQIEEVFLSEQRASLYRKIMYNDFLIVGPESDPADAAQAASATDAMRRIAVSTAAFASRGDKSGTDDREKTLWKRAGASPQRPRLIETGQAMSPTLRVASEKRAYCLTHSRDVRTAGRQAGIASALRGGPELPNTYAVMVVRRVGSSAEAMAMQLAGWLADGEGRDALRLEAPLGACPPAPGGVPVAAEVARALSAPLDVAFGAKIGRALPARACGRCRGRRRGARDRPQR